MKKQGMKLMKKSIVLVLAWMMLVSLSACGSKEEKEQPFDAKGYVEGVLDATYHSEYAAHAEDIEQSEEAVKQELEEDVLKEARTALADVGFPVSEAQVQEYVALIEEGCKKVTYTVGEAVEDEDKNYTLDVEVVPVGFLDSLEEIFTAKLTEAVQNGTDESGYMDVFLASVKESIDVAEPGEPVTVTIHVTHTDDEDGNHVYSIDPDDMEKLDNITLNQL